MKVLASLLSFGALMTLSAAAAAQGSSPRTPVTTKTADYTEQRLAGDQVVTFSGDELAAPPNGAYGDIVRRPPGVIRIALIRPRLNFVPELLKSVENL